MWRAVKTDPGGVLHFMNVSCFVRRHRFVEGLVHRTGSRCEVGGHNHEKSF